MMMSYVLFDTVISVLLLSVSNKNKWKYNKQNAAISGKETFYCSIATPAYRTVQKFVVLWICRLHILLDVVATTQGIECSGGSLTRERFGS